MWTFNKMVPSRTVTLYPGNAANCTCVRFSWGLLSSSPCGSDAAAREQWASDASPNWTDVMRSTSRSRQRERMGPVFPQSCRTAVKWGGRHKYGRWGEFGGQVTGGRTVLSVCDCVIVGAAQTKDNWLHTSVWKIHILHLWFHKLHQRP